MLYALLISLHACDRDNYMFYDSGKKSAQHGRLIYWLKYIWPYEKGKYYTHAAYILYIIVPCKAACLQLTVCDALLHRVQVSSEVSRINDNCRHHYVQGMYACR